MTTDQCIEIAENVWGMKRDYAYHGDHYLPSFVNGLLEPIAVRDIGDEVNSWQGFGRTVEAMAPKWQLCEYYSRGLGVVKLCFFQDQPKQIEISPIEWDYSKPSSLIEATHLAALEALK